MNTVQDACKDEGPGSAGWRAGGQGEDGRPRLIEVGPAWARRYRRWAGRLRSALGDAFDGGVLLDLAHVGSTAVPGMHAKPTLDVMARVHPWPPSGDQERALLDLGLAARGEHGLPGRAYYTYRTHQVHVHVVSREPEHWLRHLALRDFLRAVPEARTRYREAKRAALAASLSEPDAARARAAYQDGKAAVVAELEREAMAWRVTRTAFAPLVRVARWLTPVPARWVVAGGWALDAIVGSPARWHDDVDLAVDRAAAVALLDRLAAVGFDVAWVMPGRSGDAGRYRRRAVGERAPRGAHQAHGRRSGLWVDVLLEPWTRERWRYRRAPTIGLPLARAVRSLRIGPIEVPVMAPEAVLLFKATTGGRSRPRPKDDADLEAMRRYLDPAARAWLRTSIDATVPGHPWSARLA